MLSNFLGGKTVTLSSLLKHNLNINNKSINCILQVCLSTLNLVSWTLASTFRFACLNCYSTVTVHKFPAPAYEHAKYMFNPQNWSCFNALLYFIMMSKSSDFTINPSICFCFYVEQTFFMSICVKTVQALWFIKNIPDFDLFIFPIIYCYK